jgi:catechol 2,3-dioxygenase-like lactoylglutathione lyase family enzyme
MMGDRLVYSALLVRDYDEAIDWFTRVLGFRLVEDDDRGGGKRWVVVEAAGGGALLLARAKNDIERAAVGNQHGGRVAFFLHTDSFAAKHAHLTACGVTFDEEARHEEYGTVVVFRDLYGNRWDLIERLRP